MPDFKELSSAVYVTAKPKKKKKKNWNSEQTEVKRLTRVFQLSVDLIPNIKPLGATCMLHYDPLRLKTTADYGYPP